MRKLLKIVAVIGFLLSSLTVFGQKAEGLIEGDFRDMGIEEFVRQLESKVSYRFYYEPSDFDSLKVNLQSNSKPLSVILDEAFLGSDFHYTIDKERKTVFLTKKYTINTTLPAGLIEEKPIIAGTKQPEFKAIDFSGIQKQEIVKASTENKLYTIGSQAAAPASGNVFLSGKVTDEKTGAPLIGVAVYIENPRIGVSTDQFGYYLLTIPKGRHNLVISGVGLKNVKRQIMLHSSGELDIELQEQVNTLTEVIVTGERAANVNRARMGVEKLTIQSIRQTPAVFGEPDILRVMLTLPGVKSVGEASTGFNVRGGATDQNLILFNDATIYNPSHFFGFFSAFNPELVNDAELYKSSIPGKFGGRLASVLDVHSREGNKKKFAGSAGIGLLTTRVNVEGPLDKDKTSFILGGRTSYSNWLLKMLPGDSEFSNAKAGFYDLNLHLSHQVSKKDNLYLTGYLSGDNSNLGSDTTYSYYNTNVSVKWKHVFNPKFYGVFSGGFDKYENDNLSDSNPVNAYKLNFSINQTNLKAGFNYYINARNTMEFGLSSIYYKLNPGSINAIGSQSLTRSVLVSPEQAVESALHISNKFDVSSRLSLDFGLRYSMFNYLGPRDAYTYPADVPKEETNILDTVSYGKNAVMKTYQGPEIRLSARYSLTDDFSVKAAYNTMRQYIHLLSNTTSMAPTDIWKLSDQHIRPQFGSQISLGLYKNFMSDNIETSVEVYHKGIKDYLDYKSGAVLLLNPHLETDVVNTKGKAYGAEFMIKKKTGKLNGWLSYTYSRILLKMDDPVAAQLINNGAYYPGNYDKPHDATLVGNYKLSHRFSTSFNVTYSTGRPITLPLAKFDMGGAERSIYSDRNAYRIPDYFRTDFSINIDGNHKVSQLTHSSWTIGVYNLTGRNNTYSAYFTKEGRMLRGYKLAIFPVPVPFVNYNIRF